ncbi:MAG TPA: hypothetical protein VMX16_04245 [Terriglobia bacterium]|nr:hypothetical protein [Terriglobia bacterium]
MVLVQMILWIAVKIAIAAIGLIYAGLVLTSYSLEGRRFQPRLKLTEPARSGERLLVWWGVKLVDFLVRSGQAIARVLYDASAEVVTWVIDNSSPEIRQKVRSRFL